MHLVSFVAGLALLIVGAELLVRGASRLASAVGISPLVVGLTVVAFGTSAPELAVSVKAVFDVQAGIAIGNVIGSNIFNVLFILGLSAMISPLVVSAQIIRLDIPLLVIVSVLVLLLALDREFSRLDGAMLFGGLLVYTSLLIYLGRRQTGDEAPGADAVPGRKTASVFANGLLIAAGLALLVLGSRWLVDSAIVFAQLLGVTETVIGLTIVAAGTSMPEVVTSVVASLRGERDIAVGNVIGSNLFNLMGVLGFAALIAPAPVAVSASVLSFDMLLMIAVAFACIPIFFTGGIISRWEGALLFGYYIAYTTYLVLDATGHEALPEFRAAMLYFALPLTAVTLLVVSVQALRRKRG